MQDNLAKHAKKHSPGPWTAGNFNRVFDADGQIVCVLVTVGDIRNPKIDQSDYDLLVAAPDLLAAAEAIVKSYDNLTGFVDPVDALRAAIAKARGEMPDDAVNECWA